MRNGAAPDRIGERWALLVVHELSAYPNSPPRGVGVEGDRAGGGEAVLRLFPPRRGLGG